MTELFDNIRRAIESCPVDRLPRVLGMLREIESVVQQRLNAPAQPAPADTLLSCAEAAKLLHCSRDTLYRGNFPFVRRLGRKKLYSSAGITDYLQKQE
jgi:predicted DNA-binding transcriptional regulator AlpA